MCTLVIYVECTFYNFSFTYPNKLTLFLWILTTAVWIIGSTVAYYVPCYNIYMHMHISYV